MKIAFILKIFFFSTIVSVMIKVIAPYVEVQPITWLAITIVLTPVVFLGILLWRRLLQF